MTDCLVDWACGDVIDDANLIATELATNAVLHTRDGFAVVLTRRPEGTIRIAVRDASLVRPRPRRAGPFEGSGRGLRIVDALATAWGVDPLSDGKVVWAELRRPSPHSRRPGVALTAR